ALTHLDAALAQDRALAEAYAARARLRKANADLEGARADFNDAIRLNGALAEARAGRCWLTLEANGDLAQARDDAEAAVLVDSRNVEAQTCRGILQLRANEPGDALASFSAALQVSPGNPEALFGHGIARMRTGDGQGSRDMNRARDFNSHVGQRYAQLGVETR
ncbi:MAG TPA: tetratricopeptide repeat protein, partial [Terricaulis sp.]|nr:tetratricopeptide repeat protein [Terricaulis sp.]